MDWNDSVLSHVVSGMTLATMITTSSLLLHTTENFGNLFIQQNLVVSDDGNQLLGPQASALSALSSITIGLNVVMLMLLSLEWYRIRKTGNTIFSWDMKQERRKAFKSVFSLITLTALVFGITMNGLTLNFVNNYDHVDELEPSPNPPVSGENFKVRGPYGIALVSTASLTLAFSSASLAWMIQDLISKPDIKHEPLSPTLPTLNRKHLLHS